MTDLTPRAEEGAKDCAHCGAPLTAEEIEFYSTGCEACEQELHAAMQEDRDPVLPPPKGDSRILAAEDRAATAEAEVERLRDEVDVLLVKIDGAKARVGILLDHITWWRERVTLINTEASALRDRVAVLEEALRFYADEANYRLGAPLDPNSSWFTGNNAARTALQGASDAKP